MLPKRRHKNSDRAAAKRSNWAHRAWVRGHSCCVPNCHATDVEAAHVRSQTDGGVALKPSDRWVISLCRTHHAQQHAIGEPAFEALHQISMRELAGNFANRSPHVRE